LNHRVMMLRQFLLDGGSRFKDIHTYPFLLDLQCLQR
jgi:hypothetical protein